MNEVSKINKNPLNTGKESSNPLPPKNNYHPSEYDENYMSGEDDDIDDRNGECQLD